MYAKIENDTLIFPPINKETEKGTIFNYGNNIILLERDGYINYSQEKIDGYASGTHKIINGVLADISTTPEYITEQEVKEEVKIQALTIAKTDLFKVIYLSKGLTPQIIRAGIESIEDEQQRTLALIDFDNAKDFYRKHPLFGDFALSLGFTKKEIDDIFIAGVEKQRLKEN